MEPKCPSVRTGSAVHTTRYVHNLLALAVAVCYRIQFYGGPQIPKTKQPNIIGARKNEEGVKEILIPETNFINFLTD